VLVKIDICESFPPRFLPLLGFHYPSCSGVRATDYSRPNIGHTLGLAQGAHSSGDLGFIFICSGLSSFHVNKEKITEPKRNFRSNMAAI
jgi:hypothetical protein